MSTKPSTPFQSNGWNYLDKLGESSYMPHFYETDMTPSFRSPKIYTQQPPDYFTELDNIDDLYEATLMNSNFLQSLDTKKPATVMTNTPVNRLLQILKHVNPNTPSPLSEASSTRSQQAPMPDPRNKTKGKFKPNM
ncbi:hypothetical protein HPULCUR_005575 [Helicostylum pulchrum]|uniref:Uncharacterized protein n=1 Tax=Helicostylum pulchrum TaxID=562976 RepID=A0ABP9Y0R0_9FUNG